MFARMSDDARTRGLHNLSDVERLAAVRAAASDILRRHAKREIDAEQAAEELRKLNQTASNGVLRFFGL